MQNNITNSFDRFFLFFSLSSAMSRQTQSRVFLSKVTAMAGPITAMSSLSFSKRRWRNYILFTYLHMKQQKADSIVSSQRSRFLALPTNQKLPIISTVADRRRWLRLKTPSDSSVGQNDVARTHKPVRSAKQVHASLDDELRTLWGT